MVSGGRHRARAARATVSTRCAIGMRVAHRDQGHAGFGDAGLFARNLLGSVAEEALMVDAELRDAGDERAGDDIGRVERGRPGRPR